MPSRRQFMQATASAAAGIGGASAFAALAAVAPRTLAASRLPAPSDPEPYRTEKSLLDLQQAFLDLRFGMFIHYNMATYQDREWGDPRGPASGFNPASLDTDQWADAALSAGMKFACLTTKHHDGFCLWPTKSQGPDGKDSILATPHKTDVVRAYVDSFRRKGIVVGLYYSILDLRGDIRHHNVTPAKIARIKQELTELLTNYGDINLLIFDGWDAPWSRISYEEVPFHEIYALVKKLQPNCLISELNASQYPPSALYYSDIKAFEQNAGQELPKESSIPAQSCVTLTEGWFWKQEDGGKPLKSARQVVEDWLIPQNTRHCNLICNAAPGRDGKLAPNIIARLEEIGKLWKAHPTYNIPAAKIAPSLVITTTNLATGRPIRAIDSADTYGPDMANDGNFRNSWYLPEGFKEGWLEIDLDPSKPFNTLILAEPIGRWRDYSKSRIARYTFEIINGSERREILSAEGTLPVRIHAIPRTSAARLRITIQAAADTPHISEIGVYDEPRS